MFTADSRYASQGDARLTSAQDGAPVHYVIPRLLPPPADQPIALRHRATRQRPARSARLTAISACRPPGG